MNQLYYWMKAATPKQQALLAKKAKTSVAYLRQLAYGHRNASMDMALRIEQATEAGMAKEFADLDYVKKTFLCAKWRKVTS
jgi:transcriptional regulator with XRE-family HTH domain